jgi:radical SAM protein with 4Fe4S-binding SPASM domain
MEKHEYKIMSIEHNNFISVFNGNTGVYLRSDEKGKKGVDPFMSDFPELIDIGIMETCVCSNRCKVDCYQRACDRKGPNMTFNNYKKIIKECKGKCYQVALGGAGDPDTHENFAEILKFTAENNIVPNFTTSGITMTSNKAELCYKYCGAVAISEHFKDYTDKAVELLVNSGVKTNIHYVLSANTIDSAIEILKSGTYRPGINAVVFLLYKPVGLGKSEKVLKIEDERVKEFFSLIDNNNCNFKIGFDSCSCPALINLTKNINGNSIDFCEGARFSMYISTDMKAYPCSFANQHTELGIDLRENSIQYAWDNFNYFRKRLSTSCISCKDREKCGGGCPLLSSITLCNRKEHSTEKGLIE